ncbi:MAG: hypothetical protein JWM09_188 [Francisellaceae bacterium]|nr:hypothetical protein [Francisellaceae bacterium]
MPNFPHILKLIAYNKIIYNFKTPSIFTILDKQDPEAYIITPFPHYTLYKGYNNKNKLIIQSCFTRMERILWTLLSVSNEYNF